jgi:glutamate N-acetyltransferase/amino-acid N-acetyltransferase
MKKIPYQVIPDGSVTTPAGFSASGICAGIKKKGKRDLAIIASHGPAIAAGVFTTNQVKAAPVQVSMNHVKGGKARAIVANSGNANACTGVQGISDAKETAGLAALLLGCKDTEILICSTGRIGRPMPMPVIRKGVRAAVKNLSDDAGHDVARAIMTSDSRPKEIAVSLEIDGKTVHVAACAKGAGMIDPMMATMLCFVTTDAVIDRRTLNRCLREAVDQSFNCICVDGDMSTNDTVLALASGTAGNHVLRSYHRKLEAFQSALNHVTLEMAKAIVLDGEGVTRFVEISIQGASTHQEARVAAETISVSMLNKSAWCGGDPNWGRLMASLGYADIRLKEELVDIYYDGLLAVRHGRATSCPVERLRKIVNKPAFQITINLNLGSGCHKVYTTDLTEEYVRLNKSE